MDSVGRAKWKEFKGRSQLRVIARYADINQTIAAGTKQIPRAGAGPQTCGVGWLGGGRQEPQPAGWRCASNSQEHPGTGGAQAAKTRMKARDGPARGGEAGRRPK